MPPDRVVVLLALPMRRRVRALRALKTTAQRDRDHHPVGLEAHRPDPDPRQVQQAVECRGDAHRRRPPVRWLQTPRTYGLNLCASAQRHRKQRQHPRPPRRRFPLIRPSFRWHPCQRATPSRRPPPAPRSRAENGHQTRPRVTEPRSPVQKARSSPHSLRSESPTIIHGASKKRHRRVARSEDIAANSPPGAWSDGRQTRVNRVDVNHCVPSSS